jgi:hypothetical protein
MRVEDVGILKPIFPVTINPFFFLCAEKKRSRTRRLSGIGASRISALSLSLSHDTVLLECSHRHTHTHTRGDVMREQHISCQNS